MQQEVTTPLLAQNTTIYKKSTNGEVIKRPQNDSASFPHLPHGVMRGQCTWSCAHNGTDFLPQQHALLISDKHYHTLINDIEWNTLFVRRVNNP